jgi:uncharacterized iron-regulated protein
VERSALKLRAVLQGQPHDLGALPAPLYEAAAVCIGETHDDPHHHYAQWQLVLALGKQAQERQRAFAVGFEMFQLPAQAALDHYQNSGDQPALLRESEFERRWGPSFPYYRPLLEAARAHGAELLALNAPRETTKAIAKGGLSALSAEQAAALPELNLEDHEHRAFFWAAMGLPAEPASVQPEPAQPASAESAAPAEPGHHQFNVENLYAAQVVWDETMAATAAQWLNANPNGQVLLIAGSGHCHKSAIPRRLERRGVKGVVAARAVLASQLGKDSAPRDDQFDLLLELDDSALPKPQDKEQPPAQN